MNVVEELNAASFELILQAKLNEQQLDLNFHDVNGATVVDFAVDREGAVSAGTLLSEICMGGRASIELLEASDDLPLSRVRVETERPLDACMGGQYAGWPVASEGFFAMCSGPIRLMRGKEKVLEEYELTGTTNQSPLVGVLETNQIPWATVVQKISDECGVTTDNIALCVARTASHPGLVQIVARSVETTLHKLHELNFDLRSIKRGVGTAPVPPIPSNDDMTALGWTNDSILYGASVKLTVETSDEAIEGIIEQIPSCSSDEFGTPFLEIFNRYDKDFYKIDKRLFSPAKVSIFNQTTGSRFAAGDIRNDILKTSWGME